MERAFNQWLTENPELSLNSENWFILAKRLNKSYTIYGSLLLWPSTSLANKEHHGNVNTRNLDTHLLELIGKHMKVDHIAINQPIPLHQKNNDHVENVIRSPSNFQPLYGDFGPATSSDPPSQSDLDAAYWVTAKQNGIYQTWAPRWTMFSRGNITEKARLLSLPSVLDAVADTRADGRGCTAVDLYAGIGYFAFSYLKAGFSKVLCWDLNPWSCEGLRRGAIANKWESQTYGSAVTGAASTTKSGSQLLIFNESNENAVRRIRQMHADIPPIRHVNCGLLPSSKDSWAIAVTVIDRDLGGWVHVHENFATAEIELKGEEVRRAFEDLADQTCFISKVTLEDVHQVKTYAPGVWHCVLDIHLAPTTLV